MKPPARSRSATRSVRSRFWKQPPVRTMSSRSAVRAREGGVGHGVVKPRGDGSTRPAAGQIGEQRGEERAPVELEQLRPGALPRGEPGRGRGAHERQRVAPGLVGVGELLEGDRRLSLEGDPAGQADERGDRVEEASEGGGPRRVEAGRHEPGEEVPLGLGERRERGQVARRHRLRA